MHAISMISSIREEDKSASPMKQKFNHNGFAYYINT